MGFYDELKGLKKSRYADEEYADRISTETRRIFDALGIPSDKWGPLNLPESDLTMGQERIKPTRHMVRTDSHAMAYYTLDVGGFSVPIDVLARVKQNGDLSIEFANVKKDLCNGEGDFLEKVRSSIRHMASRL